jgi:hypothetical protein
LKNPAIGTYEVSQTFEAPIDFVFDWCTDFREDDGKMTGSKTKKSFLERTKKRIIWTVSYKEGGKTKEGLRVVWLQPPNSWRLDTCGDGRELGSYKLTRVGKNKTRLDMVFEVTYDDSRDVEDKETWERSALGEWDTYAQYLENDFKASTAKAGR